MRLPNGRRPNSAQCGIRIKWLSGRCTPLYQKSCNANLIFFNIFLPILTIQLNHWSSIGYWGFNIFFEWFFSFWKRHFLWQKALKYDFKGSILGFIPSCTVDGYKNDKKCCTSLSCYFYALRTATVRTPRRLPPYGPSCLVLNFFSPNPRFWAG